MCNFQVQDQTAVVVAASVVVATSLLVDCVLKKFTLVSLLWWWPSCCFRYISDLVTFAYTQPRESVWKKYSEFYLSVDSIALILRLIQQIFFTIAHSMKGLSEQWPDRSSFICCQAIYLKPVNI